MTKSGYPQRGEVWYVELPNQPHDPHQPRTAIVVSVNGRNKYLNDVMVVPTTSSPNFKLHPFVHVRIPAGEGGLSKDSVARCDQLTTLDKLFLVRGPIGAAITFQYMEDIVSGVRAAMGDPTL